MKFTPDCGYQFKMTTIKEYIELAKKHLIQSDTPISSSALANELERQLNLPTNTFKSSLFGMALSQLKVKASNGWKPSASGFPKKFRQFCAAVNINNGNLEFDNKKMARRKLKAKKTRKLPKTYNSQKWRQEGDKFYHRDFNGRITITSDFDSLPPI